MINLDFLEIGTSNFNTLIQKATDDVVGISVEPVALYLDQLPDKKNVTKVKAAISPDDVNGEVSVYYIPENVIVSNKLPLFLRGCNSINDYHPQHKHRRLEHLVVEERVRQFAISTFLMEYGVHAIKHLKIDTEGHDCAILQHLRDYISQKPKTFYPLKITFETNTLSVPEEVSNVIEVYKDLGYIVGQVSKEDTILVLK